MQSIDEAGKSAKPASLMAILSLLFSATLWGVFWYPLRLLDAHGMGGLWASFFIYLGTTGAIIYLIRGRWREFARAPWMLIGVGIASGWTNIAFILSVLDGNVVRVLLLFYLSPIWATLLGWLLLGERLSARALAVLGLAMLGAVVMLWQTKMGYPWPQDRADWLALSSGFAFAVTNVMLRHLQQVSVQIKTISGWLGVIGLSLLVIAVSGGSLDGITVTTVISAIALGALMIVAMTLAVVYGVTHMPVHQSAVILLFELVAGTVSSLLLTSEVITVQEWVGGALVILAAWLSATENKGQEHG